MRPFFLGLLLVVGTGWQPQHAAALEPDVREVIVGIAPGWDSMQGRLQCFRRAPGGDWQPATEPVPVLFGKSGLAWGRGTEGTDEPGLHKREHDGRAPAGVFKLGTIYTYDPALPAGADYPFHTVNGADAWVDDPSSANYNRHVAIPDVNHPPAWFDKQKMRHGDFAYRWLVEIRHNADPPRARGRQRHLLSHPKGSHPTDEWLHHNGGAEPGEFDPVPTRRRTPPLRAAAVGGVPNEMARLGVARPEHRGSQTVINTRIAFDFAVSR